MSGRHRVASNHYANCAARVDSSALLQVELFQVDWQACMLFKDSNVGDFVETPWDRGRHNRCNI